MAKKLVERGRKRTRQPFSAAALRIGEDIRQRRKTLHWTVKELAHRIKVSQPAVSKIEAGQFNPESSKGQRAIESLLSVLSGDAPIPIAGRVAAGQPIEFYESDETISIDRDFIRASGELIALRVSGESMLTNHIIPNDILICRRDAAPRRHAITVVELKGERGTTVKRWERSGDDITLCADFDDPKVERLKIKAYFVGKAFEVVGLIRAIK